MRSLPRRYPTNRRGTPGLWSTGGWTRAASCGCGRTAAYRCRCSWSRGGRRAWYGSARCTRRRSFAGTGTPAPTSRPSASRRSIAGPLPACSTPTGPTRRATASTSGSASGLLATPRSGSSQAEPAVGQARQLGTDLAQALEVEVGYRDPHGVRCLRQDRPPRVDHHAAPEAGTPGLVVTDLRRGEHVALVLDGARPQQHLPMVASGVQHERGRYHEHLGAIDGEPPVQLGEAQVVADRQAERHASDRHHHGLGAGGDRARLVVGDTAGDLHVVQMDLPVGGGERAVAVEDQRSVERALRVRAHLVERAGDHRDVQLACGVGEERGVLAVDRFRLRRAVLPEYTDYLGPAAPRPRRRPRPTAPEGSARPPGWPRDRLAR